MEYSAKQIKWMQRVDEYINALQFFSVGATTECPKCLVDSENGEPVDEGHFTWNGCECCGTHLGTTVYPAHWVNDDGEIEHDEVCADCMLYVANGEPPDDEYLDNGGYTE